MEPKRPFLQDRVRICWETMGNYSYVLLSTPPGEADFILDLIVFEAG